MDQIGVLLAAIFESGMVYALVGAAAAVILSGIGSAIGIGYTASASAGVMTEDPRNFGKYLILVALPGTQGIYGFVAAFLVIMKVYLAENAADIIKHMTTAEGLQIMYACLPIAFAGLVSAIHQGKVCTAGVALTAKQPSESGKALVFGVFVEFYAVLGLIVTIFLLNGIELTTTAPA
jgi:V/A-type H+-transporting ATPase subunit K